MHIMYINIYSTKLCLTMTFSLFLIGPYKKKKKQYLKKVGEQKSCAFPETPLTNGEGTQGTLTTTSKCCGTGARR